MCNPCICGRVIHLTMKVFKGEEPHILSHTDLPLGTWNGKTSSDLCLPRLGRPGPGSLEVRLSGAATLQAKRVQMATTGFVSVEKMETFPTHTQENLKCPLQAALLRSLPNNSTFLSWIVNLGQNGSKSRGKNSISKAVTCSSHTKLAPNSYHRRIIPIIIWMTSLFLIA